MTEEAKQAGKRSLTSRRLMSRQEVADFLRVTTRTVDRMIRGGKLPAHKVGAAVRIEANEVAKLLGGEEDIHAKSIS